MGPVCLHLVWHRISKCCLYYAMIVYVAVVCCVIRFGQHRSSDKCAKVHKGSRCAKDRAEYIYV